MLSKTLLTTTTILLSTAFASSIPSHPSSPSLLSTRQSSTSPSPTDCSLTITVSGLTWHNSTHNLDCGGAGPDPGNNTTCINNMCGISVCETGLPTAPYGYGPADTFRADLSGGIGACFQSNPGTVPLRAIGDDYIRCSGSAPTLFFKGSSLGNGPRKAKVVVQWLKDCSGANGDGELTYVTGEKMFELDCTHDRFLNATCTAKTFQVMLVGTPVNNTLLQGH